MARTLPRWFEWLWALLTIVNAYGIYLAYGHHEMLHGHLHVVLTILFGWLWIRKAKLNAAGSAQG